MKPDFRYIRVPLIFMLLSITISAAVYLSSSWHEESVLNQFYAVERGFNTAKRQYEEANKNRSLYERYLANYLQLLQAGFIGEEQRLDWIELLQNIDKQLNLPRLNYAIEPKKPADLPGINLGNNVKTFQSEMGLKLEVLHEDDLFELFESITKQAKGFYSLSECEFVSQIGPNGPSFVPNMGNLSANCDLRWITVMVNG